METVFSSLPGIVPAIHKVLRFPVPVDGWITGAGPVMRIFISLIPPEGVGFTDPLSETLN